VEEATAWVTTLFLSIAVLVDGRDGPVGVTVDPVTMLLFVDPPCLDLCQALSR
jgi:hypothetical protein